MNTQIDVLAVMDGACAILSAANTLVAESELRLARAAVAELIEATRARRLLSEKIKHAGMPPHPDYWQQSVSDADARIDAALARIGSAS